MSALPYTFGAQTGPIPTPELDANFAYLLANQIVGTGVVNAGGFSSMQAAYNTLPATGGIVLVPPGWTETWAAPLVMNKPFSGFLHLGPATITMGSNGLVMNDLCPGQFIDVLGPVSGADFNGQVASGVFYKYTAPGTNTIAMQIGQGTLQTGNEDCFRRLRGFALNIELAGSGTIGIQLNNQVRMQMDGLNVKASGAGTSGMIGCQIQGIGTGFSGWVNLVDSFFNGGMVGVDVVGQCNLNSWVGGGVSTETTGGSWGIRRGVNSGGSFLSDRCEFSGCHVGIELKSGVAFDVHRNYFESNDNDYIIDAGATFNTIQSLSLSSNPIGSDLNTPNTTNVILGGNQAGGSSIYLGGNGAALTGMTTSSNIRKLLAFAGGAGITQYGDNVADILTHQFNVNGGTALTLTLAGLAAAGGLGLNGAAVQAKVTGWGTPTGPAIVNNFSGGAATLVNCSNAIAKIITDLKAIGIYGA